MGMDVNGYGLLLFGWIQFSVFHSVFAALWFKQMCGNIMRRWFTYYRPMYSLFATLSLVLAIYLHVKAPSTYLINENTGLKIAAVISGTAGIIIMYVSGRKYFMHITGLDVIIKPDKENKLELGGLHKLIRHPLYSGTLLFVWSFFLWQPLIKNGLSAASITIYVYIGTYFEEKKLILEFGETYKRYKKNVPMFIPYIFKKN